MQNTRIRGSAYGRAAYFNRIAGENRYYLDRVETDLNRLRRQAHSCGPNVPDELRGRIADLERKARDYKQKMNRALFNAGRR